MASKVFSKEELIQIYNEAIEETVNIFDKNEHNDVKTLRNTFDRIATELIQQKQSQTISETDSKEILKKMKQVQREDI